MASAILVAAQDAPTPASGEEKRISSIAEFWNMPAERRAHPHPIELEVQVLYNDPVWGVVQVRDHSAYEYIELPAGFDARSEDVVQ